MLGIMRKYKESIVIKIVFVIIVASFIGTIFLVWGKGDSGSTGGQSFAAKVNGSTISLDSYQQAYYRLRNIYDQLYGKSLSPELEKSMGLKKQVMDSLVDEYLIAQASNKMSISVSKDDIANAIAANPSFQKDGAFDFGLYQQILKSNRMTPKDFEDSQKQELLIKKARKQITDKATVSDDEALAHFHKKNDRIELSYLQFTPAALLKEVKLTDADLTSYLQAHENEFKSAEQIALQYTLLDPASLLGKVSVSDDDIQTYYQKNIDRYQGKDGILPLAEVKDKVKTDAARFKAAKLAYEMAADAANKFLSKNDLNGAAAALSAKVTETPLFSATQPPPGLAGETELIKRSFTLKTGELGGPIETPKGIYILKVKDRLPAAVPPLNTIRARVETAVRAVKAAELAKQKAESALAGLAKGESPAPFSDTGSFSYAEAGAVPKIGTSPEIMEAAFTLSQTAPLPKSAFKLGDSWIVIKLKNRVVADKTAFASAKESIKQQILPKKQQDALNDWLKELRSKAKIEINETLLK